MVRISDARMSGTAYGTCVVHVLPESHIGGPLALVRDGDRILLDVSNRRLDSWCRMRKWKRRSQRVQATPKYGHGYLPLYAKHVTQALQGCDFDFLE